MSLEDLKARVQLGKHLTLVERQHLMFLGNIPGHVVAAFSTGYELCDEFQDQTWVPYYKQWLDYNLILTASVGGRRASDLVAVLGSRQDDDGVHTDAGHLPPSRRRLQGESLPGTTEAKNGMKEVRRGVRLK